MVLAEMYSSNINLMAKNLSNGVDAKVDVATGKVNTWVPGAANATF
ncbi:MAG: hypothetical protein H8D97_00015 [Proteobacteria bacterium]|nr:hypothetical protein [Pseudomonadota bacterium]